MKSDAIIVPLAYPDTLVKKIHGSKGIENIFSKKGLFKVGHASTFTYKKRRRKNTLF